MNSADTSSVMAVLAGAYPSLRVTDEMVLLWAEAFAQTPSHVVTAALRLWIENEEWPPTIAGIRDKARQNSDADKRAQEKHLAYSPRALPNEKYLDFEEGKKVAAFAYARHCAANGLEPSWTYWNKSMGIVESGE